MKDVTPPKGRPQHDGSSPWHNPFDHPQLFENVRTKRFLAFLLDALFILFWTGIGYVIISILGIVTLGLAWLLFALVFPFVALIYTGFTLGGVHSATPGMFLMGLQMRFRNGQTMTPIWAIVHVILFWFLFGIIGPFIALPTLFSSQKRCLHDMITDVVMIRADAFPT
jgi:uncharacterized RDD family membrane protein YckC